MKKPVTVNSVPAYPSVGDILVIDSTVHVVERNSTGSDDVGTDSEHELALRVVQLQDGVGIGTEKITKYIYHRSKVHQQHHTCWSTIEPLS